MLLAFALVPLSGPRQYVLLQLSDTELSISTTDGRQHLLSAATAREASRWAEGIMQHVELLQELVEAKEEVIRLQHAVQRAGGAEPSSESGARSEKRGTGSEGVALSL